MAIKVNPVKHFNYPGASLKNKGSSGKSSKSTGYSNGKRFGKFLQYTTFPISFFYDAATGQLTKAGKEAYQSDPNNFGPWMREKLGGLKDFAAGEPAKELKFDLLTPDQKELFIDHYLPYIREQIEASKGKSVEDFSQGFDPFANKMRQDYARSIPSIAERFGIGGARGADFLHALGAGQGDLETNIQAQRAQFGLQNRQNQWQNTLGALGYGNQSQIENAYIPRQPGFFENILTAGAGGAAKAAGAYFGGKLF